MPHPGRTVARLIPRRPLPAGPGGEKRGSPLRGGPSVCQGNNGPTDGAAGCSFRGPARDGRHCRATASRSATPASLDRRFPAGQGRAPVGGGGRARRGSPAADPGRECPGRAAGGSPADRGQHVSRDQWRRRALTAENSSESRNCRLRCSRARRRCSRCSLSRVLVLPVPAGCRAKLLSASAISASTWARAR